MKIIGGAVLKNSSLKFMMGDKKSRFYILGTLWKEP